MSVIPIGAANGRRRPVAARKKKIATEPAIERARTRWASVPPTGARPGSLPSPGRALVLAIAGLAAIALLALRLIDGHLISH